MAVKAVLFDFGGVLVASPLEVFAAHERRLGIPEHTISRTVVAGGETGAWARLERGELGLDEFVGRFAAELRAAGAELDVAALMRDIGRHRVRPQMLAGVRRARGEARTALVTNNWRDPGMDESIAALRGEFDVVVESCREGLRKPDPRLYELVCDRLGVRPDEAVFLDDLGSNLKPARAMGMTTIKVDDPDQALAELDTVLAAGCG